VVTLFNDITGAWSEVDGGGLHWNKDKTGDGRYKTSCSNAPAMILAARLYLQTGEQRYLDWALRIYEYMYSHSRFPDGVVKDHATHTDHEVTFSYNQGTWVGGLLELYKISGEEHYRTTATELLDLLLFGKWYSPKGIMNERQNFNQDDGGMFKGIFVRYLTQWILSGKLDSERQYLYTKWLLEQARAAELSAINKTWFIINPYWTHQYNLANDIHDTSRQQTGMMLMEAIDELRRAGLLNDDYSLPNPHAGEPFRYYRLVITETQGSGSIMLGSWKLFGNASPTAITSPTNAYSSLRHGESYNLKGIAVNQPSTGIYVKEHRKFHHTRKY
jgi:predicted alpha-1,6-mannanase (GH76 family)